MIHKINQKEPSLANQEFMQNNLLDAFEYFLIDRILQPERMTKNRDGKIEVQPITK